MAFRRLATAVLVTAPLIVSTQGQDGALVLRVSTALDGKGGTLRTTVRNWCYTKGAQVRAVLPGEDASPFDERARSIASECGISAADDLGPANEGMTIVWVK